MIKKTDATSRGGIFTHLVVLVLMQIKKTESVRYCHREIDADLASFKV